MKIYYHNDISSNKNMVKRTAKSLAAEAKFHELVRQKGGTVIGTYVDARTGVEVICANKHTFYPSPHHVNSDGL